MLKIELPKIPSSAWQCEIGKQWSKPYTVRYDSNLDDGPNHGMPLGGFGAGCVGRGVNGEFNLWHIDGGNHTFQPLPACQFSVFEEVAGETPQVYAMSTTAPEDGSLSRWSWYPEEKGTYSALYPRSWFVYEQVFKANLSCEQFSPIWAHNYQET